MIPSNIIDEIIETARIEEVVGDYVALKKRGSNYLGCCPFHNEKTPSFTVSPAKGIYKCFGCGVGGNSVNFIMEHDHMSYPEALKHLANKYGIDVPEVEKSAEEQEAENERESLFLVSQFAENEFIHNLWESDEGKAIGLSYFRQRSFSDETIEKFKLGYSLESWDALTKKAVEKGYQKKFLVDTGLTIEKEDKTYDRFRSRVVFPIHNLSGRTIAFGARTLLSDTKKTPKYLNSPETDIYHKSRVLYGIYQAKKSIISTDNCFLVEGYTDVISLHQAGIENVVASSGTSLTTEQIRLVKRYTNNITILYDGDAAGIKASFRGIDMILEEGMNVKVLLFPEGEDPDSFAKSHSTVELNNYLEDNTEDFIQFKSKVLLKDAGDDPIQRAGLIKDIVQSIAKIPDGITRSVYVKECSTLLSVDEETIIDELNHIRNKDGKAKFPGTKEPQQQEEELIEQQKKAQELPLDEKAALHFWESEVIRLLISYGDREVTMGETQEGDPVIVVAADYIIHQIVKDNLEFDNEEFRIVFADIKVGLETNHLPSEKHFFNHENQKVSQTIINLLSQKYSLSENWSNHHQITVNLEEHELKRALKNTIYTYKMKKLDDMIRNIQESLKSLESSNDLNEVLSEIVKLREVKKTLAAQLGIVIS